MRPGRCEHSDNYYRYGNAMATTMTQITRPNRSATGLPALCGIALWAVCIALVFAVPAKSAQTDFITLSLTRYAKVGQIDAGQFVGVSPGRVVIHVGDSIVFQNADTRHHTATGIAEETTFPDNPRWTDNALQAGGKIGAGAWSTGDLAPGAHSSPVIATKPGTYLYGCFFDYSAGMRGEIVVQP